MCVHVLLEVVSPCEALAAVGERAHPRLEASMLNLVALKMFDALVLFPACIF